MAKTASKTESGILGTVHKTAAGLHRVGVIDRATMHESDAQCLKQPHALNFSPAPAS